MTREKKRGGWWDTIKTVIYAVLIAFAVRTFLYEPFNIPSGSMRPTLLVGDYLFVSKFSYGYSRHTVAFGLPLFDGRLLAGEPERGDVVVFKLPSNPNEDYIKRLIGMPGDVIEVVEGVLHINGEAVPRRRVEDFRGGTCQRFGTTTAVARMTRYIETLPNGREHFILECDDNDPLDNAGPFLVPDGHYFMMGDNRDNSQDSRVMHGVGFVPYENLVGRADLLWFSLEDASFWEIWKWPVAIRFSRMFTSID